MVKFVKRELNDYKILLRSIPSITVTFFVVSVILMNLLANREIQTGISWLALDCGLLISWLSFLSMDMITKRFGARASIKLSFLAVGINVIVSVIFFGISKIPGNWAEFYTFESDIVNIALDNTIAGTWYIILGSIIAFITSSFVNNPLNAFIGKHCKKDNFVSYALRTYISTSIGQFVDNLVFALIVSHVFFGWTLLQCITCAITGMFVELLLEVIFSPFGYKVCKQWEKEHVGQDYIDLTNNKGDINNEQSV